MNKNILAPDLPLELSDDTAEIVRQMRHANLSQYATRDNQAIRRSGRDELKDSIRRPAFLRDSEKIIHTPAYNRLAGKTQVFSFRDNDDLTRRGLHVQLVSRVARDIGLSLGLNLDLIEAIALGHDIGHTPFGHAGERFLNDCYHERTGGYFMHNVQSVRVLDTLYGRNLSLQTLDGIICHNGEFEQQKFDISGLSNFKEFDDRYDACWTEGYGVVEHMKPMCQEGCVVRIADIIAYVGKDRQDAIAAGLLDESAFDDGLGGGYNSWALAAFTVDVIENSIGKKTIGMSKEAFDELRRAKKENGEKIYFSQDVNDTTSQAIGNLFHKLYEHELNMLKQGNVETAIFKHHIQPINEQLSYYGKTYDFESNPDMVVVDFISSMTDDYFIAICEELFDEAQDLIPRRRYFDHVEQHLI